MGNIFRDFARNDTTPVIPAQAGIQLFKWLHGCLMSNFCLLNRLKVARAEKNLSQEQLAALAAVTRQTISSIETGQYNPSALLAMVLAKRLEKRVEDLFFLEEKP